MMPTHILWDNDGVLVDTEPLYFSATRRALNELGFDIEVSDYLRYMAKGRTVWEIARDAGKTDAEISRHRERRNEYYQALLRSEPIEIEGAEEVLSSLAASYRMAIVTTSKRADFDLIHRNRGFLPHMDFVLASGDYARSKPAPDPYLAALERFGIDAESAVVIEDSERGLTSAVNAGIRCIVVANAFTAAHDFSAASARIDSLKELPAVLETM